MKNQINNNIKSLAIIIPCWNEEMLLPKMLDCLLKQTFKDWEAFCVDDQSTDGTREIIKAYHVKDKRIQYVCRDREPKGGQTCRNIGFENSIGAKYICFFDADDLVAPYCLEQRVKYMDTHSMIEAASFPLLAFNNDIHEEYGPVFGVKTFNDDLEAILNNNLPFCSGTDIYRRDSLVKYHLYWDENVKSKQDAEFHIQMLLSGLNYNFADGKADYFYRVGRTGVAQSIRTNSSFDSHIYFIDKVTQTVSTRYGNDYDFYLKSMIVSSLKLFHNSWRPYFQLLRLPWLQYKWSFKLRILLYLMILKKDRRFIFYKYRRYSKQKTRIWEECIAVKRMKLLEKGVEL